MPHKFFNKLRKTKSKQKLSASKDNLQHDSHSMMSDGVLTYPRTLSHSSTRNSISGESDRSSHTCTHSHKNLDLSNYSQSTKSTEVLADLGSTSLSDASSCAVCVRLEITPDNSIKPFYAASRVSLL